MKKIVCELCEGTNFVKENGMFVCQGCGTKYSAEEAKSMMQEVEGDTAPVTDTTSAVLAGNPNQQQIDNILILASNAYDANNKKETENYCNKAIELDATCYKAWMLKGKSIGWQSKIDDLRIEEASHSFCKAIDFAPEEEKENLKTQAVEELKKLGLALISLRKQRFSTCPDKEELDGFTSDKKVILDSLLILLSHGNAVGLPEGYLEEVASLMNQAGVAALNTVREVWNKIEHPGEKDWHTYIDWLSNIEEVFRQAINTSDDDDEEDITRYKNLIIALEEPIGSWSWKREWVSYASEYRWFKQYRLADSAVAYREEKIEECKEKIEEIRTKINLKVKEEKEKAEKEKRQRIEAYWEAHKEEKIKLETELKELTDKKRDIELKIETANSERGKIVAEAKDKKTPSEIEINNLKDQISSLNVEKSGLGFFAKKRKTEIENTIANLESRVSDLNLKAEEERSVINANVKTRTDPIDEKINELENQRNSILIRIDKINEELNKDPEE